MIGIGPAFPPVMNVNPKTHSEKVISALCLFVVGCILVAGLWPFHTSRNSVSWLKEDGLRFGGRGAVVSERTFDSRKQQFGDNGFSLEICLTSNRMKEGTIFAFDSSPDRRAPFSLRQYGKSVVLRRYLIDQRGRAFQPWIKLDNVLEAGKRVFITITSDKSGLKFYVNGTLALTFSEEPILSRELNGRLVLGNSTDDDSWIGDISGLAIYGRQLDASEVARHVETWTREGGAVLATDPSLVALYAFNEHEGSEVHNLVDSSTNLNIPARYFVLFHSFLRPTWEQYKYVRYTWNRWSLWEDLIVNVFGFMPVGFVFFAYFSSGRRVGHPALYAVLVGFVLSFAVEVVQWFLPNRDSGMTDLFTNTFGTALGVLVHQWSPVRTVWNKILALPILLTK